MRTAFRVAAAGFAVFALFCAYHTVRCVRLADWAGVWIALMGVIGSGLIAWLLVRGSNRPE